VPLAGLIRQAKPDRVLLLGDIFNKGPDPAGTWALVQEHRAEAVLGNHDAKMLRCWDEIGDSAAHVACRQLPEEARDWLSRLPLFLHGDGWIAVHAGLHPVEGVAGTDRRRAITLRRWPDDADPQNPFWWQLYVGEEHVYYGHDAVRGLQLHERTTGLDTGCCYGKVLSGWLLEERRLVQEPFAGGDPAPLRRPTSPP
jgi:hypothetical protein